MIVVYTAGAKSNFDAAGKNVNITISNALAQIDSALAFNKITLRDCGLYRPDG